MEVLRSNFSVGYGQSQNLISNNIQEAYRQLIPEVDTTWPGVGTGIVASVDQVRKITVAVIFGKGSISSYEALDFKTQKDWWFWCRADKKIAADSQYAFADIYDFAYGLQALEEKSSPTAIELWKQAASNIDVIADSLANCYRTNSILQPICMAAELSMKGALLELGVPMNDLKKNFGHKFSALAEELSRICPHLEDKCFTDAAKLLPDYVQTRYEDGNFNRLQLVKLALSAQFIAASALRRLSGVDQTVDMSNSDWPGPRQM